MGKNNNTNEVVHMLHDIKNMTRMELMKTYNVEMWEDGSVYDLTLNEVFKTAADWANFIVDQDGTEYDDLYDDKYSDDGDFY